MPWFRFPSHLMMALTILMSWSFSEVAANKPHIVFVLADDYGYNDVGYHGSEIKTPNLDEISAKGVKLENYYVQTCCSPSRSQFMSGRYQIRTGLQHAIIWSTQANALPTHSPTIADKLKQSGYATHLVGEWHLGFYKQEYIPINRGFDTFYGMTSAMDEGVGNVTRALKEAGMWENTVFVFSSDMHIRCYITVGLRWGEETNYPLRGEKASLFEGGMRAVGFVHAANMKTSGIVSKALMHISDWYPTFVALAWGSLNDTKPLDGFDQWEAISQNIPSPRKELLHNIDPLIPLKGVRMYLNTFDNRLHAALRFGDWKVVTGNPYYNGWRKPPPFSSGYSQDFHPVNRDAASKNMWLFNLKDDPYEQHDLAFKRIEMLRKMLDKLAAYNAEAVPVRYPPRYDSRLKLPLIGGVLGPWINVPSAVYSFYYFIPLIGASGSNCVSALLAPVCCAIAYFIAKQ